MTHARALGAILALCGTLVSGSATCALAQCLEQCGYVDAYIESSGASGACFMYSTTFQCKDYIHLTGGEAGACEYYSEEPIARYICTGCVDVCNFPNDSVEATADHDNCQQYIDDHQGICHDAGQGHHGS